MATDYSSVKAQYQANLKSALNAPTSGISITPPASTGSNTAPSVGTLTPNAGSGLGSNYQNLAGTNYFSTNAGNPNAAYYNADGSPVANVGITDAYGKKTEGFTSNANLNSILQAGDASKQYAAIQNLANTGGLQTFGSIAGMSSDPRYGLSGGTTNLSPTSPTFSTLGATGATVLGSGTTGKTSTSGLPEYGSNVQNFDPNNPSHVALANAGQDWARAKAAGDTAGMTAAAKRGEEIRAGLQGSTFDSRAGVSTLGTGSSGATTGSGNAQGYTQGNTSGNTLGNIFSPGSYGGYDPTAQEKAYLAMQLASLTGQNNSNLLSTQYGIDQNKAYLQEQLASLNSQEAVDKQAAQELQNRRGGFYSGGLDYQLGGIDRGYTQAESALGRDIGARNQQLIDQYGNQANTIAQQIQQLQFNSPDILRQRIQDYVNNERNYGLNYANTFGNLNGMQTLAANNQNFNQQMDIAGLTGMYDGQKTADQAQREWENRFAYGQAIGKFNNGQQTTAQQQQELQNLWTVADATGVIPNALADMYGIPRGTKTQEAKQFAQQLAISQQNANTSKYSAETSRQQENRLATQSQGGNAEISSKESANNAADIRAQIIDEKLGFSDALIYLKANQDMLSDSDYNKLMTYINGIE